MYTFRAVLRGISPLIWRRRLVRADSTIADLHDVLQVAFGWSDEHLNRFLIRGREYGVEHEGGIWFRRPGHEVVLCELGPRAPERFTYEYDLGDCWVHDVHLEASQMLDPGRTYRVCIGGRRAAPPEDCGGPAAFIESRWRYRLQARCSAAEFEEIEELLQLDEDEYPSTDRRYDPERFDQREVNRLLSKWTSRRSEGSATASRKFSSWAWRRSGSRTGIPESDPRRVRIQAAVQESLRLFQPWRQPDSALMIAVRIAEATRRQTGLSMFASAMEITAVLRRAPSIRPESVAAAARKRVVEVDPDLVVYDVATMEERLAATVAADRFLMALLTALAAAALALAVVGVYGVTSYGVSRRTAEIGVRMALGATPARALALVLGQTSRIAALGVCVGVLGALATATHIRSLLYETPTTDPPTLLGVAGLVFAVAVLAAAIPARRAAGVDPAVALRCE